MNDFKVPDKTSLVVTLVYLSLHANAAQLKPRFLLPLTLSDQVHSEWLRRSHYLEHQLEVEQAHQTKWSFLLQPRAYSRHHQIHQKHSLCTWFQLCGVTEKKLWLNLSQYMLTFLLFTKKLIKKNMWERFIDTTVFRKSGEILARTLVPPELLCCQRVQQQALPSLFLHH